MITKTCPKRPRPFVRLLSAGVLLIAPAAAAQSGGPSDRIVRCPIKVESPLIAPSDLKDPIPLALKIRDAQDAFSGYLRTQLSPETQRLLNRVSDRSAPPELQDALVADLNRLLQGPSLFSQQFFARARLSDELQNLIASAPLGEELILLNRLLLETAYPQEIVKDLNRPVPKGLTITSVKVTGRRGVGPIENELQKLMAGKTYTPELHRQAVRQVSDALTTEANRSFEKQAGIEGGAYVSPRTGATFLYITQCVEIDNAARSVDMIVKVLFVRADLRDLASNILPLPRSLRPSFYDRMPVLLRAFNPLFDAGFDRRIGPIASLKLSTNLLALRPLLKGEEINNPESRLDFDFSGAKALVNRFYQTTSDLNLVRERPGKLLEHLDFRGGFSGADQPLSEMRTRNTGLHLSGQIKLRPRLGMLNSVYLEARYDATNNKVFDQGDRQIIRERDNTGAFRGVIDGRLGDGFTRLAIWFETTEASKSSIHYRRLAGIAGVQKEFGSDNQTFGFEAVAGAGKAWGPVPIYSRFFGGNNGANFLYESPDAPAMKAFPVGPLLRSYGKAQATVPSVVSINSGGTFYWHGNLNLTVPVRSWSRRLIPDEEVDSVDPITGLPTVIKLNKMLENFTINTAINTLTDTLMDDIIDELMKNDPTLTEDEATRKAEPIAAARAKRLVNKEVAPTMRFISRHANLYAVKPMIMLDAAYLSGTGSEHRQRFAAGGGIQLVMIIARAEIGYLRSLPSIPGESKGNFVLRLTFQNIF